MHFFLSFATYLVDVPFMTRGQRPGASCRQSPCLLISETGHFLSLIPIGHCARIVEQRSPPNGVGSIAALDFGLAPSPHLYYRDGNDAPPAVVLLPKGHHNACHPTRTSPPRRPRTARCPPLLPRGIRLLCHAPHAAQRNPSRYSHDPRRLLSKALPRLRDATADVAVA